MPNFLSQIKANQIPITGLVAETVASLPGSPVNGQVVYHTADHKLKTYQNGTWATLDSIPVQSVNGMTGAVTIGKADVGLGNVDNTSDASKPISTATQNALNLKAPLASPALTGIPTAPTAAQGTSTTQLATTAFVTTGLAGKAAATHNHAITDLYSGTPGTEGYFLQVVAGDVVDVVEGAAAINAALAGGGNVTIPGFLTLTGGLSVDNDRISNVGSPLNSTDAATKGYVDSAIQGLAPKESVRLASTANVNLGGTVSSMDGIALAISDRVLLKDQTAPAENGIYAQLPNGTLTRTPDADSNADLESAFVFVEEGTANANTAWLQTADNLTIGTSAITWVKFISAADITVGNGLQKVGNQISVSSIGPGLLQADAVSTIKIQDGAVTAAKLDTGAVQLGSTKTTGILPIGKGGTGSSTAQTARVSLEAAGVGSGTNSATINPGVWTTIISGTNLQAKDIDGVWLAEFFVSNDSGVTYEQVQVDWRINNTTFDLQVRSDVSISANALLAHVHGAG